MENTFELIITILNRGFSETAMDSARLAGATGGTIVTARGAGAKEVERLFGITVSQEKEIILILAKKETRNAIMTAICKSVGLNTQGKGITFSLPVSDVLGVSLGINVGEKSAENTTEPIQEAIVNTVETSENTEKKVNLEEDTRTTESAENE